MNRVMKFLTATVSSGFLVSGPASAETVVVKALGLKFEPMIAFAKPGDTIAWENMPTHDAVSMEGLIPEGAQGWQSPLGENFMVTLEKEGVYIYKCSPHYGNAMLGAIVVGQPVNLDAVREAAKGAQEQRVVKKLDKALASQ
jgi:Plastocyanin